MGQYLGQNTNTVILLVAVASIVIVVGSTLYFQLFLGTVSTEKGNVELELAKKTAQLTQTLEKLNLTESELSVKAEDVGVLGDLYNSTKTDLETKEADLQSTIATLLSTQNELVQTKTTLSSTESELNTTKATLKSKQDLLTSTEASLTEALSKVSSLCDKIESLNSTHSYC